MGTDIDKQDKMQALVLLSLVTVATCYLESAPYDVVKEYEGWEVRSYPPTRWVSTLATDVMPHDGEEHRKAFYRLFHYIDGGNEAGTKIPIEGVFIEEREEVHVVATRFGGFPSDITFSSQAAKLYDLATQEGLVVREVPLWTAGYDGPSVIIHRRNEVWLEI